MYKLCYFVPERHLEQTKQALFAVGAGRIGDYDCCAWLFEGQGQFRPMAGGAPFLGQRGELETVEEFKVVLVCVESLIKEAVAALKQAPPYEEPAYEVFRLESL